MADKASRALLVYGDGFVNNISHSHSHIHSLASKGSCGFLSLRNSPSIESMEQREVSELSQLLDAYGFVLEKSENVTTDSKREFQGDVFPSISERFMGLNAAMLTNCTSAKSLSCALGFTALRFDEFIKFESCSVPVGLPDAFATASELLQKLGFVGGDILENREFDLVLVHVKATEEEGVEIDWLNTFVGSIMQLAQPGSNVASRFHFSLIMSYKNVSEDEADCSLDILSPMGTKSNLSLIFPCQSYTMKGGSLLKNIRHHHPMLLAQFQEAVTRRDLAKEFSFQEFQEHGGNLAILADRFLHELAFKLWKAPKYGA